MRSDRRVLMLLVLATTATCGKGAARPSTPTAEPIAAEAGPGPELCADLDRLIEAARHNFPDLRRTDQPITIDHEPGFAATVSLPNTVACRILTSEPPYPDAYECDLAPVASPAQAKAVIDRWAPVVAACPQLATWHADEPTELGRGWQLETGDDHELVVRLFAAGDDHARPTLVVRRNEI